MRRRRGLAIAGLSCALLGAWGAIAFLRGTREGEAGSGADEDRAKAAAGVGRALRSGAGEAGDGGDASARPELKPTVVAFDPRLEWPDVAALRKIEQRGRALFGGIVYAPDGSPCAGASIFCNQDAIATSDGHGAWRADVSRSFSPELDAGLEMDPPAAPAFLLAAHKEGVGFAEATVDAVSRRVDLHLHGGFSFRGTVIDNDDLRPVRGAELEARVRSIVERARADARGDFCFPSLPSGDLELSGRAPGYDSNGSFSYNFDRGRDVEISFRLTKAYRLRGQFSPWPAPGVAPNGAAVVLSPRSPHGGTPAPKLQGEVGDDGSFDVTLPVCPKCDVELAIAGRVLWQTALDVNEEKHDVDLGRIEITESATLSGRVALPEGGLGSDLEVLVGVSTNGGFFAAPPRPIAADGSFRVVALPAGIATAAVDLDGDWFATLRDAGGLSTEERDFGHVTLAPGETRDVGVITTTRRIVVGTVRDGRGEPVALAQLMQFYELGDYASSMSSLFPMVTDEDGRFHLVFYDVNEPTRRITLGARARGFAPGRTEVELVEGVPWSRCEIRLPDGVVLRGKLLDATGAPFSAASIRAEPADAAADHAFDRAAYDVTQADGSFEIRGVDAGEWRIEVHPRGGPRVRFDKVRPEAGPLTLRVSGGAPAATPPPLK